MRQMPFDTVKNECENDILSVEGIAPLLDESAGDIELAVFGEIDSTNLEAKRRAKKSAVKAAVIIADSQTAGRGRFGRSFFSPPGCGIYLSVLLRPNREQLANATLFTTAAAAAVCRAIERVCGLEPQIKWVNDIYLGGKKVCGILSEAVCGKESGAIDSIVIGLGINFKSGGELPDELRDIVGTLFGDERLTVSRNKLAAQVINELFSILPDISSRKFLEYYRSRSMLLGQEVVFSRGDKKYTAMAENIDDDGALVVRFADGKREALNSGEVSVRPGCQAERLPFPGGSR